MAAKETKTVTLRLPKEMVEYLTRDDESINQAIIDEISRARQMKLIALLELKGIFSKNEWIFFADAFNGTLYEDFMCGNVNIFIADIEDAERYENKATMHKVDLKELIAKLKKLHGANINAIYERISDYWDNYQKIDIEKWADF